MLEEAMRARSATLRKRLAGGMPRAGWKVCINDARMQKKLGLSSSFPGFLDGNRALLSGGTWKIEDGSLPGVEPEFAVRFRERISDPGDPVAVRAAIEGVAPALEIVDWRDARLDLESIVASSSFHAGFVVGDLRALADVPRLADGWPRMRRGEEALAPPDPSLVPEDLVALVSGMATLLAAHNDAIERGDWLLCGACTSPARVEAGDTIVADFGPLGEVRVRFEG